MYRPVASNKAFAMVCSGFMSHKGFTSDGETCDMPRRQAWMPVENERKTVANALKT